MKNIFQEPELAIISLSPQDEITQDKVDGTPGVEDASGVFG